jgi:AraC-like DNA-binding protein
VDIFPLLYKDIANTYAFASQSYYGKMFKKWVGMTPREYRIRYADFDEA